MPNAILQAARFSHSISDALTSCAVKTHILTNAQAVAICALGTLQLQSYNVSGYWPVKPFATGPRFTPQPGKYARQHHAYTSSQPPQASKAISLFPAVGANTPRFTNQAALSNSPQISSICQGTLFPALGA